jgi:hypothetical protein
MHQSLQGATFHVEHIVPRARGGKTAIDNLAWACPACNLHKSDRTHAQDPDDGNTVLLYHPRTCHWSEHLEFEGYMLAGKTPSGRATIDALQLNDPRRLDIRKAESRFGLFPP